MPCRATQDGQAMVESSDKMWSPGEGNGKPFQYSCLENPMNSMKRRKDRRLKDELLRSVGAQHAAAAAKSLQLCPTPCDPIDGSPPGSPIPGILQARVLEWVAIAFSTQYATGDQFSSITQSCLNLCDPMNHSTPVLPVHHQLPELTQTHIHLVNDAIQLSHPLMSPSPPTFNLPQHQGLFQ